MDTKQLGIASGIGIGLFALSAALSGGGSGGGGGGSNGILNPQTMATLEAFFKVGGLPAIILIFWFLDRRSLIKAIEDQNEKLIQSLNSNTEATTAFRTYTEVILESMNKHIGDVSTKMNEISSEMKVLLDRRPK